jgi:hypothetical protein
MKHPVASKRLLKFVSGRIIDLSNLEAWFVTGSQHLYGPEINSAAV